MTRGNLCVGGAVTAMLGMVLHGSPVAQTPPAEVATPPEITIQDTPAGPMMADLKGFTLYVTDRDTQPGRSSCYGACAEQWPPVRASAEETPFGDWTLIAREDGLPQWAYKGRPLYRYRWEAKPRWPEAHNEYWRYASVRAFPKLGEGRRGFSAPPATVRVDLPPSPGGITAQLTARGVVFADSKGMTLYARASVAPCTGVCLDAWIPLPAPHAASAVGAWTVVSRSDGTLQWAYHAKPVYRSARDAKPSDAHGADDGWQPMLVPAK